MNFSTWSEEVKIGLLGGTFNPVHLGHLDLAAKARQEAGLSEVWWIPAMINPHRQEAPPISYSHRKKMIEMAIAPFPGYQIQDLECKRPPPSYSVDTLVALRECYPDDEFHWILGADAIGGLPDWREIDKVLNLTNFIFAKREGEYPSLDRLPCRLKEKLKFTLLKSDVIAISSTEVRKRLKKNEDCSGLLPDEVIDYIRENMLY